jgi:hypothetical protein
LANDDERADVDPFAFPKEQNNQVGRRKTTRRSVSTHHAENPKAKTPMVFKTLAVHGPLKTNLTHF